MRGKEWRNEENGDDDEKNQEEHNLSRWLLWYGKLYNRKIEYRQPTKWILWAAAAFHHCNFYARIDFCLFGTRKASRKKAAT